MQGTFKAPTCSFGTARPRKPSVLRSRALRVMAVVKEGDKAPDFSLKDQVTFLKSLFKHEWCAHQISERYQVFGVFHLSSFESVRNFAVRFKSM